MGILENIRDHKVAEVRERKRAVGIDVLKGRMADAAVRHGDGNTKVRSLGTRVRRGEVERVGVIAEIKRKSPSKGMLRSDVDVRELARIYSANGASGISVLTDERFFGGSLEDLRTVRGCVDVPVLRKDFIIDPYQLYEAREAGADAVLLIVRLLDGGLLDDLLGLIGELGMEALVESHTESETRAAVSAGAGIIGVNNRDLTTFDVDIETAVRLRPMIPDDRVTVAESGIATRDDVLRMREAGYDAVLVGETLMRSGDPGAMLRELSTGAGR